MDKTTSNEGDIVSELLSLAEKKGDLPIFSASLNNVRRISSDPEADAMELAQTVMKDTNLCSKLLRIANSPYYSRGLAKISSVSRAVVLLGFDVIKSLCLTLKLIENFQDEHPTIGMHKMVARSYLAASFVRDIAILSKIKNPEETYVSGLCHNIGEIAVGYFMPDTFDEIFRLSHRDDCDWEQAQKEILGLTFSQIGQSIGREWNFSDKVIHSMGSYISQHDGVARSPQELNHAIVSLSSHIVDTIYLKDKRSEKSLRELFTQLEASTGVQSNQLERCLSESFTRSCELINNYGLDSAILSPPLSESEDNLLDKFSRDFSFMANNHTARVIDEEPDHLAVSDESPVTDTTHSSTMEHAQKNDSVPVQQTPSPNRGDVMIQLAYIQEITQLVTEHAPLSALFMKILQGLIKGVGFDRAALALVTPDRQNFATRIVCGENTDVLKLHLKGSTHPGQTIFSRLIDEGGDLLIDNIHDGTWNALIPESLLTNINSHSIIIAGLKRDNKAIGLFYADNDLTHTPISADMRRGFIQFVSQARLAVQIVN